MPVKKYTEEDQKRALRLYEAGMSGPEVEAVTGMNQRSVLRWARDAGITRPRSEIAFSESEKREIIYLYKKNEHTMAQIAEIMKTDVSRVFYFLNKKGVTRTPTEARRVKYRIKKKRARKMYKAGEKQVDIARRLRLHPGTLYHWKRKYGWKREKTEV